MMSGSSEDWLREGEGTIQASRLASWSTYAHNGPEVLLQHGTNADAIARRSNEEP